MALTKYWSNNLCTLQYKIGIDGYTENWYKYTEGAFKNCEFILIESLLVPMEVGNEQVMQFLDEFCRIMTIENKIIVYDNELFIKYLFEMQSNLYYDACINILDEILTIVGFDKITIFDHLFLYKDVYVYTKSKIGFQSYNIIENYFYEEFYD